MTIDSQRVRITAIDKDTGYMDWVSLYPNTGYDDDAAVGYDDAKNLNVGDEGFVTYFRKGNCWMFWADSWGEDPMKNFHPKNPEIS